MSFDDFTDFAIEDPPRPAAPSPSPPPPTPIGMTLEAPRAPLAHPPVSPTAARAKAGLGVVAAFAGAGAGAVLGGPLGALTGFVGVGALRNLYRSQGIASTEPTEQGDAARSLALGVIGVAIVGFLGYKIYNSRKDD